MTESRPTPPNRTPDLIWRWMRPLNRHIASRFAPRLRGGHFVLLLTTIGRVTGLPRQTPLQYEEVEGAYYVGSARGKDADWYRNILAHPKVEVQVGEQRIPAIAEPVSDPGRIADFLALRLERSPRMVGMLLRLEGLPKGFTRDDLEAFAAEKTLVILHPCEEGD